MRVVVLCTDLGIRIPGSKGASLHLQSIVCALARAGHSILLIAVAGSARGGGAQPDVDAGWPDNVVLRLYPHPGRAEGAERERRKLAYTEHVARDAEQSVREFQPDVIYERLSLFGDAGTRLARVCQTRHVVEVNALLAEEETTWRGLHHSELAVERERLVLASADLRVAVSEPTAAAVRRIAPDGPTEVLPNGFEAALFASLPEQQVARRDLALPPGPLLGFAGSLRPWHGLDVAVAALADLPGVALAVAGDGPVRAELTAQAAALGVHDRLLWLGQLPHRDMSRFLAALDVAVLPYPNLPDLGFSPLKLYEYAAAALPVVASDIGPGADVIRALDMGVLVTPGSASSLAAGVRSILDDRSVWRVKAQAARARALAEHTWDDRATRLAGWLALTPVRANR